MRDRIARQAVPLALAIVISGCATTVWWGNQSKTLRMGMTDEQVRATLGSPQDILRQDVNGVMVETWKYLDRTMVFQNGVLQSWQAVLQ